jgi:large subunit ribosomal protein L4
MELEVLNINGQKTGATVKLSEEIFGINPNDHAIYLDVKQYLANQRQGTHKAKERSEVAYSTRKIKRQKGTGGARAGDIKSPVFVGGGRVFGPRPRDYFFKVNKKVKELARKSALTYKAKDNNIVVVEDFAFDSPKTKQFVALKNNLKLDDKKMLLVVNEPNKNVYLSSRNLPDSKVLIYSELNTYEILNADVLVFTKAAIDNFQGKN